MYNVYCTICCISELSKMKIVTIDPKLYPFFVALAWDRSKKYLDCGLARLQEISHILRTHTHYWGYSSLGLLKRARKLSIYKMILITLLIIPSNISDLINDINNICYKTIHAELCAEPIFSEAPCFVLYFAMCNFLPIPILNY